MKVAIIGARGIGNSPYSGIEKCWTELCPRIAALGHHVHVFSERSSQASEDFGPNVRVIQVPAIGGKYTETLSRSAISTLRSIAHNYDVMNFAAIGPGIFGVLPRLLGKPVVASIQGLDWQRDKWPWPARAALQLAERTIVASANEIVVVSRELQKYYREKHKVEVSYIPNGVEFRKKPRDLSDLLRSTGVEQGNFILFASRLVPEKGAHELIAAFNDVKTDMKLVIAGAGRYDSSYVQSLRAADRTGRCIFTGHVSGPLLDALFHGTYLYVLPSHMEGLSLSLLEAIGCSRAALVSDIRENIEVIGESGFSFPVRDIASLRQQLQHLIDAPRAVEEMGRLAAVRANDLMSWDAIAQQYSDLYINLARGKRTASGTSDTFPAQGRSYRDDKGAA